MQVEEQKEGDDVLDDVGQILYVPPVSQLWESRGSEKEIEEEQVVSHRKPVSPPSSLPDI